MKVFVSYLNKYYFQVIFTSLLVCTFCLGISVGGVSNHINDSKYKFSYVLPANAQEYKHSFDSDLESGVKFTGKISDIYLYFDQPVDIGKIVFLSRGLPNHLEVYGFGESIYKLGSYSPNFSQPGWWNSEIRTKNTVQGLYIVGGGTESSRNIDLREIVILGAQRLGYMQTAINFFTLLPRNIFTYFYYILLYVLLFFFLFYPIGYRVTGKNRVIAILSSCVFAMAWFGFLGMLYLLKWHLVTDILLIISFIVSILNLFKFRLGNPIASIWVVWALFLALLIGYNVFLDYSDHGIANWDHLYNVQTTFIFPYKNYEQDYITPYSTAKVFMHDLSRSSLDVYKIMGINWITDRTPLISFICITLFRVFGERFFIYELFITFSSSLLLLSTFVLLKKLFNSQLALVGTLWFSLTTFLPFFIKNTPSKAVALFVIQIFLFFFLRRLTNKTAFMGFFSQTVAYLLHPVAIVYSGILALRSKDFFKAKSLIKWSAIFIFTFLIWNYYSGTVNPSSAINSYAFAPDYYELVDAQATGRQLDIKLDKPTLVKLISNKTYNVLSLFFGNPHPGIPKTWNEYRNTLIGVVGKIMFPICIIGLLLKFKSRPFALFILPILIYISLIGFYNDLGLMLYLIGVVPIFLTFGLSWVIETHNKVLLFGIWVLNIIEMVYVAWWKNFYIPIPEIKAFWVFSGLEFRLGFILIIVSYGLLSLISLYELRRRV